MICLQRCCAAIDCCSFEGRWQLFCFRYDNPMHVHKTAMLLARKIITGELCSAAVHELDQVACWGYHAAGCQKVATTPQV